MNEELSLIQLMLDASLLVQLVMVLLLAASVFSWIAIFKKRQLLGRAERDANAFEERFWSGADLARLYEEITANRREVRGMERLFEAGFREYARLRQRRTPDSRLLVEGAQRAMRITLNREMDRLEQHLSFLATVGSTSPYVGLFGTVWGIMNSFRALGNVSQATIAMVAPGISEALIATAMGLFAAIPAVVAYNKYANQAERLLVRYETFVEEFSSILHRQAHLDEE